MDASDIDEEGGVKTVAQADGPAAEIETARTLLESGAINEAEFERIKAKALGG